MLSLEQGEQNSLAKMYRTWCSGAVEDQEELKGLIFDMGNGKHCKHQNGAAKNNGLEEKKWQRCQH